MHKRKKHTSQKSNFQTTLNNNYEETTLDGCRSIYYTALALRIISVFVTQTSFVPDEYWQSTEVAHRQAFSYGYLTWEWKHQIRSYFYPFLFEVYFKILGALSLEFVSVIRIGPHLMQAVLTAFYDVAVYKYTYKLTLCRKTAIYSFYLNLTSWFIFYTGARTLTNVAEMCFSTIGLSYFPSGCLEKSKNIATRELVLALLFGGLACIIRPTCLLIWVPLVLSAILRKVVNILTLAKACFLAIPVLLVLLFGIDFYFYGSLTFVHWNFLNFNVFQNIGEFYGVHSWHWYFTQGLPVVFNIHLLFFFLGMSLKSDHLWISFFYIFVHSLVSHKEFRFLLPIFPIFICFASQGFQRVISKQNSLKPILTGVVLLINFPIALYFCMVHQRGTIDVMNVILKKGTNQSVLFLMPCHSTPYYSYLHQNIPMKFLTCEPSNAAGYMCESDQFFQDPQSWLIQHFDHPTIVITYDTLPQIAKTFLQLQNYTLTGSLFHTHFPEGQIGRNVDIYSKYNLK